MWENEDYENPDDYEKQPEKENKPVCEPANFLNSKDKMHIENHQRKQRQRAGAFIALPEDEKPYQCGSCKQYFTELKDNGCPYCGSGNYVKGCIDETE